MHVMQGPFGGFVFLWVAAGVLRKRDSGAKQIADAIRSYAVDAGVNGLSIRVYRFFPRQPVAGRCH